MNKVVQLAMSFVRQGEFDDAEKLLLQHSRDNPDDYEVLEAIAVFQVDRGHWDKAISQIQNNIDLSREPSAKKYQLLGALLGASGINAAEQAYKKAININSSAVEAYLELAHLRAISEPHLVLKNIETQLESKELADQMQSQLHFAAGKLLHKDKQYKAAFAHYTKANNFAHKQFSTELFNDALSTLKQVFTKEFFFARENQGIAASSVPIFLVGMPQSGTPVLERMMIKHSAIASVGERADMVVLSEVIGKINKVKVGYPVSMNTLTDAQAKLFAKTYIDKITLQISNNNISKIIDNSPLNFLHIGLIHTLLPDAKFIYVRRNPLDSCLACYFQPYPEVHGFNYSMESLAEFYVGFVELMEHWKNILPKQILEVNYDDLVVSPDQHLKKAVSFCDLDWEPKCGSINENNKPASINASLWQLRKANYQTYDVKWQCYAEFIQPLRDQLAKHLPE